jgi:hypothetical protein
MQQDDHYAALLFSRCVHAIMCGFLSLTFNVLKPLSQAAVALLPVAAIRVLQSPQ